MKIIDREEFLKQPAGTLFHKYEKCGNFGTFEIKRCNPSDNWVPDFLSTQLNGWISGCHDSDEFFEKNYRAENGEEFQFDLETSSRDGLYEKGQLFAIYDRSDIERLIELLKTLLK